MYKNIIDSNGQIKQECEKIILLSKLLFKRDLTDMCGGNVSISRKGFVLITPTCVSEYYHCNLKRRDLIILDDNYNIIQGKKENLSRESELHFRIYKRFKGINSIFHLHTDLILGMLKSVHSCLEEQEIQSFLRQNRINICFVEDSYVAQTEEHDNRIVEILSQKDVLKNTIIVLPHHGILSTSIDIFENFKAVDILSCKLNYLFLKQTLGLVQKCR